MITRQEISVDLGVLPDEFEDWLSEWNTVNDGYIRIYLDRLEECPFMKDWIVEFKGQHVGFDSVLVHVSY